jgi:hypothetical protein
MYLYQDEKGVYYTTDKRIEIYSKKLTLISIKHSSEMLSESELQEIKNKILKIKL